MKGRVWVGSMYWEKRWGGERIGSCVWACEWDNQDVQELQNHSCTRTHIHTHFCPHIFCPLCCSWLLVPSHLHHHLISFIFTPSPCPCSPSYHPVAQPVPPPPQTHISHLQPSPLITLCCVSSEVAALNSPANRHILEFRTTGVEKTYEFFDLSSLHILYWLAFNWCQPELHFAAPPLLPSIYRKASVIQPPSTHKWPT